MFAFGCVFNECIRTDCISCHVSIVFQYRGVGGLCFLGCVIVAAGYQESSTDQNSWEDCSQVFWVDESEHKLVLIGLDF